MMKYGRSHERQHMFSSTAEEDLFEEKLSNIPGCPSTSVIL
jgi:hypothetical protein